MIYTSDEKYQIGTTCTLNSFDSLPPGVKKVVEQYQSRALRSTVKAPPPTTQGYRFFVMPAEDVYLLEF